ncbi:hypothetical protein GQ457_10G018340 [Hibiscus cannabinus]
MVGILKVEVLGEHLSRTRSESLPMPGLCTTLEHLKVADIHVRLTCRVRTYICYEIANYILSVKDLDYPSKQEHAADVKDLTYLDIKVSKISST